MLITSGRSEGSHNSYGDGGPRGVVPVALYGMPYDCDRIMEIADKYGIPVVEATALNDVDNIGQNGWVQHSACARG